MAVATVPSPGLRVTSSRPSVAVRGRDDPSLAEGLMELRIEERTDGLYRCEACFGNWGTRDGVIGFLYFDRRLLDFGAEIGFTAGGAPLFGGRISGLEAMFPEGAGPVLRVLAEDRHADLRTLRRTRTFTDVTDAVVFRRIAAEHGLTADVALDGPSYRVLAQLNQSDLAFLRDRARVVDAELWMDGTTLFARSRAARAASRPKPLTLSYGNDLRELRVLADLAGQRTDLAVSGWDVAAKQALAETAGESLVSGELAGGRSGAAVLAAAFGARRERVVQGIPLTRQEARSRAEAMYRRIARRFLTARGLARPTPGLRVGATVRLEHLGDLFTGDYYVTEVTHLFDGEEGLRTEFTAERAGLGGGTA